MPADPFAAYQTPATVTGDPFAAYQKPVTPATLPNVTNQDIKSLGRKALDYAPAVGATAGALLAPEAFFPAVGAAMLGGAAGSAVKQGALAVAGAKDAPQSWSEAAGNVAQDTAEQGAYEAGGRLVAKPLEYVAGKLFGPRGMYQSALKPSVALDKSLPGSVDAMEAQKRVQTGLREGIPTSEAGYNKTVGRINETNQEIGRVINQPSVRQVDPLDVAKRLDDLETYYSKQALAGGDIDAIKAARRQYLEKHGAQFDPKTGAMTQQPNLMTPVEAQEEKVATYAQNRKKYGEMTTAQTESEKTLARGLKEEILNIYPELKDLNERDSSLYGLEQSLRRFVGREGNKNLVGLIPAVLGAGAGAMAGHGAEGAVAGSLLSGAVMALDSPPIKSSIAIALQRVAESKAGKVLGQLTPTRVLPIAGRTAGAAVNAGKPIDTKNPEFGQIPRFARGGVIRKPTLGLVGEAGPERIVPVEKLQRTPEGRATLRSLPQPEPVERTAAQGTVPEKPEALRTQLQQLAEGQRKVVMFPRGTSLMKRPKGMQEYTDADRNAYIFNPQLTSQPEIDRAIESNSLPDLLGPVDGGMGVPDKSALRGEVVNVAAKQPDGDTVQSAATDRLHMPQAIQQAQKITPPGGKVAVEDPAKEVRQRMKAQVKSRKLKPAV